MIVTPHTSFYSEESLVDLQTKAAEEVVRVLSGQAPRNPVNPEALKSRAGHLNFYIGGIHHVARTLEDRSVVR